MEVYPLTFQPIFKPRIWGGRKLETLLGKRLPAGQAIGESWEIADLEEGESVVAAGPAEGQPLGAVVREWGSKLTGSAPLVDGRFPLLIKYLDASETLSVQVHPDEPTARRMGGGIRVKHEAWYVVSADEGGYLYRGLREGVDPGDFRRSLSSEQVDSMLNRISARKGHAFYLPAGTIHALGGGVTVAEVQTPSDVTLRLHDWERVDPASGGPRELHVEQALSCVSSRRPPFPEEEVQHLASVWTTVTTLIRCPSFTVDRVRMVEGVEQEIPADGFVIWMVLEGRCSIVCDGYATPFDFARGETVLIPAGIGHGRVRTLESCMWLEVTIPKPSSFAGTQRLDRERLKVTTGGGQALVPLNVPRPLKPSTS